MGFNTTQDYELRANEQRILFLHGYTNISRLLAQSWLWDDNLRMAYSLILSPCKNLISLYSKILYWFVNLLILRIIAIIKKYEIHKKRMSDVPYFNPLTKFGNLGINTRWLGKLKRKPSVPHIIANGSARSISQVPLTLQFFKINR